MHPIKPTLARIASAILLMLSFYSSSFAQPSSKSHLGWLRSYTLSASNKYLVTAGTDGQLGVWDYVGGKPLIFFPAHEKVIADVVISADDQYVFSVDETGWIKKWSLLSGKLLQQLEGHPGPNVTKQLTILYAKPEKYIEDATRNQLKFPAPGVLTPRLAVHKNGNLLSGGQDALVKFWDTNTGKLLWSAKGHNAAIMAVGISPDGKYCLSAGQDDVLNIWNTADGKLLSSRTSTDAPEHPMSFTAADQQLITTGHNFISSLSLPELKETSLHKTPKSLRSLASVTIRNELFYAPSHDSVAVFQLEQKSISKKIKLGGHSARLVIDQQGRVLFLDKNEKQVKVFDLQKASVVKVFEASPNNIQSFKFGPQGKYLLLNDGEEQITVMDWSSVQLKHFPLNNPSRNHFFSLDDQNQKLLTSSSHGDIVIWDLQSDQRQSFDHDQIGAAANVVWIKGTSNFAVWDLLKDAFIYTGKNWLNVKPSTIPKDEAVIRAGQYELESALYPQYQNINDLFLPYADRKKLKKYGIFNHLDKAEPIYNRDSTKVAFVSKGSTLGIYNWETDKLERQDLPVQYSAWVGNQSNYLFVIEKTGAYIQDIEHGAKILQYPLPPSNHLSICPSGAHFLLLTPEQNLEIREVLSGKLLATLSWKVAAKTAQISLKGATSWAQVQQLTTKSAATSVQQHLDQLNPHARNQENGVAALLPNFGLPPGSISDLIFTKDAKTLVGAGYSTLTIWDLPAGRVKYIIENEFCKEIEQMVGTDDPKIVHIHFKKQGPYSSRIQEALNTIYWALNVETGKINKLPKKIDEAIPTNQLNSKSQDLSKKPSFIGKDLSEWTEFRIALSPRKTYLAFAYNDLFELWDYQKQQLIYKRVIEDKVEDLLFDEAEKQLAISTSSRIQIIDLGADKVTVEFSPFSGSLSTDPIILETGDIVYESSAYKDSGKSIISIFNLPTAKMNHHAAHTVRIESNGQSFYSFWHNGHELTIYDDTGDAFNPGITESNAWPRLSKNKQYLVYIDPKGALVIWDNQTRKVKHQINGNERYEYVRFDERDSLVVAHSKKNIELYQLSSGKKILNIPINKSLLSRFPFHFSANSRYLAYINADNHIAIWDLKTLQQSVIPIPTDKIIGLSHSSNKIAVLGGHSVIVYSITGKNRLHQFEFNWTFPPKSSRYFPEVEKIVVAASKKLLVLDVKTGEKLMTIHPSSNNDWIAHSEDGLHFETNANGIHQMAYLSTSGQVAPFTKKDTAFYHEGMVKSAFKGLPIAPQISKLPAESGSPRSYLNYLKWFWEVNKPIVVATMLSAQQSQLSLRKTKNIQFLDQNRLVHQNSEGKVELLESSTMRVIKTLAEINNPLSSQVSKNQLYWVFIQHTRQICLWSIPEMRPLKTLNLEEALVSTLLISPDNKTLLAGCTDGKIRLYNLPDLQEKRVVSVGKFNIVALAQGNTGSQVLALDASSKAHLYDLETDLLRLKYTMQVGNRSSPLSAQFNADDTFVLINTDQHDQISVYSLKNKELVFQLGRYLMSKTGYNFFDPVDPHILYFTNALEFFKINLKTGQKLDSLRTSNRLHSYNPFKQQFLIDEYDDSSVVFDLRSWRKIGEVAGKTPPQILYFGDQLQKIYYPDPNKNGVYHEYDWSKNSITATLDQAAYQEQSKTKSNKPYSLILKKDSVQITDNQTGKMLKQFLWPRPMPKKMNISKSGRYLAYPLESTNTTELFDLQLNKVVLTLPFAASSYFFSLNDQYFFANNTIDKHMQVVELSTLQTKDRLYQGFSDGIQVIPSVEYKNTKVLFFHDKLVYQFINTKTGQSLGSFYFLFSAEGKPAWAFIAPDGRFDGSEEALRQFYYVDEKNLRTVPVEYKSDPKYQAGLLQNLLK